MINMRTTSCLCFGLSVLWTLTIAQPMPKIKYLHVVSEITYRFSRTKITTKMVNNRATPAEAHFDVDLPNEAFINGFTLTSRGIEYPGQVKEREQAKQEFQEAKALGKTAGTVIARQRNTNSFRVKVNVAANDEVQFDLIYYELLKRKKGFYSHMIYLNPGQLVEDFLVSVSILESQTITTIKIPPLQKDLLVDAPLGKNDQVDVLYKSKKEALVTYMPTLKQQAELSDGAVSGKFIVEYDIERFNDAGEILVMDGFFVHYLAPEGLPPIPMDIVFIFDKSGSMQPLKISQLKAAMFKILDDVQPDDRILMMSFSHMVRGWGYGMRQANSQNKLIAKNFVKDQMAYGGTNINDAILTGLRDLNEANQGNRPAIMVFLTDGKPTQGEKVKEKILANIFEANELYIPIFTLAFGLEADYDLLKKIASQNFGIARKIFEDADAKLQITGFYDEIAGLLLEDVSFTYLNGTIEDSTVTDTKFKTYFKGTELLVAGKIQNIDKFQQGMQVKGKSYGSKDVTLNYPPNECKILPYTDKGKPIGQRHPGIMEKLWAYLTVKQLLEKREAIDILQEVQQIEDEIIRISLKYQFVTPLTSMIVTLPDREKVKPCQCGEEPRKGSSHGISNNQGAAGGAPPPPFLPGQGFGKSDIDRFFGGLPGAFAKKKEKQTISSVGKTQGGSGTTGTRKPKAGTIPRTGPSPGGPINRIRPPPISKTPVLKKTAPVPKKIAKTTQVVSSAPMFVAKLPGMGESSLCFNLPLTPNKIYSLLDVNQRRGGQIWYVKMGQKLVNELEVNRKTRRATIPIRKFRDGAQDTVLYRQLLRGSGLLVTVLKKAGGLVIIFKVNQPNANYGGLLGDLRQLGATAPSSTSGTARITLNRGTTQRTVTATEITYKANQKCWLISAADMASLNIDVNSFLKP